MAKVQKKARREWTILQAPDISVVELGISGGGDEFILGVGDASTLREFLAKAKALWLVFHHDEVHGQGRPSKRGRVIQALWRERPTGRLGLKDTHGKFIALVQKRLGSEAPSKDAIRKYVKMWVILRKKNLITPALSLPTAELQWFDKHAPRTMRMLRAYAQETRTLKKKELDRLLRSYDCPSSLYQRHLRLKHDLRDFQPPADISP